MELTAETKVKLVQAGFSAAQIAQMEGVTASAAPAPAPAPAPPASTGLAVGAQFVAGQFTVTPEQVQKYAKKGDKTSGLVPVIPARYIGKGQCSLSMGRFGEIGVPAGIFPVGSSWTLIAVRQS